MTAGQRQLSDTALAALLKQLQIITVSSSTQCGADASKWRPTATVTTRAGSYVDNIDMAFAIVDALAQ